MGARARPLPADEVAVGCRDRTLAGPHRLAVGGKAHRAARLAPLEARLSEDRVEAFGDSLTFDVFRTRHDPGPHAGRDPAATRDLGRGAQIAQSAVGARAD